MMTSPEAELEKRSVRELDMKGEKWEQKKKEEVSKSLTIGASFLIIALSILFSFDWSRSPVAFNPIFLVLGILLVILVVAVYAAAVERTEAGKLAKEQLENRRERERKEWVVIVCYFIVVLSILFSFDWSTSPSRFNPMIMFFGFILAVLVYAAVVKGPEATKRTKEASQRTWAILGSIDANLARLGQAEERLTQFELRLSRLEESKRPPPPSL